MKIILRILLFPVFLIGMIVFLFLLWIADFQEHWIRAEKKKSMTIREVIEKAKGLSFKNGMAVGILIGGVVVSLVISVVKV